MAAVTIIEAPPGFGKTALVAEWARDKIAEGALLGWVRMTSEVDEASAFLRRVRDGLLRAETVHRGVPVARPPSEDATWLEELAKTGKPLIVVIDDAHLLGDPDAADELLDLVARTHSLHVVVSADTDHHFRRAAATHGLETNVVTASELSVAASDVPAFAAAWGHHLDLTAATLLHDLIGGWLLPLRLVLDATPLRSPRFATYVADEFLLQQVLPALTDTAEFAVAMRLAVPERLDLDLATTLLEGTGSPGWSPPSAEAATTALQRRGLLWRVPHHDHVAQWRFPRLVRRALLESFEYSRPEAAREAHRDVARAMYGQADAPPGDVLRHARAAEDWALLGQLWDHHGWSLAGADAMAFEFAYASIPDAARKELASLDLAGTLGDGLASTVAGADWIQRAETVMRHYMQAGTDFLRTPQRDRKPAHTAEMLTAAMIGKRSEGHLPEAIKLAGEAGREFARARVLDPNQVRTSQEAWFHLQNAITHMSGGHFSAALEFATSSYQVSPSSLVGSGAAGLIAGMHAISGQAGDAAYWLGVHDSIDVSGHWAAGLAQLPARLARAMLALDRLDDATAEAELEGTALGSEVSGLWPMVLTVHTRYALMYGDPVAMLPRLDHLSRILARHLRTGDSIGRQVFDRCSIELTLALGEVNRVQSRLGDGPEVPAWLVTPAARFHLMIGDPKQAVRIASAGEWRTDIHVRDRLQLLVISALAFRALGRHDRCAESVRRAYALTKDTGNLEPFRLIPAEIRAEILDSIGLGFDAAVTAKLAGMRELYPQQAELIQLSPRELEVLRQIPHHETASGLARTLSVSVNTVRKQLVSLYAKLGVHDRPSALLRARRLGLLADQSDHGDGT